MKLGMRHLGSGSSRIRSQRQVCLHRELDATPSTWSHATQKDEGVNYKKANYFCFTRNEARFMEHEDFTEVMSNDRLLFLPGNKGRSSQPTVKHLLLIDSASSTYSSLHFAGTAAV